MSKKLFAIAAGLVVIFGGIMIFFYNSHDYCFYIPALTYIALGVFMICLGFLDKRCKS